MVEFDFSTLLKELSALNFHLCFANAAPFFNFPNDLFRKLDRLNFILAKKACLLLHVPCLELRTDFHDFLLIVDLGLWFLETSVLFTIKFVKCLRSPAHFKTTVNSPVSVRSVTLFLTHYQLAFETLDLLGFFRSIIYLFLLLWREETFFIFLRNLTPLILR